MPILPDTSLAPQRAPQDRSQLFSVPVDPAGRSLVGLGSDISSATSHLEEFAKYQAYEAHNNYEEKLLDLRSGENGYEHLHGSQIVDPKNGVVPIDYYAAQMAQAKAESAATLKNPFAQKYFDKMASTSDVRFNRRFYEHLSTEGENYKQKVDTATGALAVETAGKNYQDPDALSKSRNDIVDVVQRQLDRGMPPEQAQVLKDKLLSGMHTAVLTSAIDDRKIAFADQYLTDNKNEIEGASALRQKIALQGDEVIAQSFARSVLKPGATFTQVDKQLVERFGDDPQKLKAAREEARLGIVEANSGKEQAQKDASDRAYQIYAKTGDIKNVPVSLLDSMDGRARVILQDRADADAQGDAIKTNLKDFDSLNALARDKPKAFIGEDLNKYALSPADHEKFSNLQRELPNEQGRADFESRSVQMAALEKQLKFDYKMAPQDIYDFEDKLDLILQSETPKGQRPTFEQRQKVIDRMFMTGTVPGEYYGTNQRKYADVVGTPEKAQFKADIPAGDLEKIVQGLRAKGRPITDEAIIDRFNIHRREHQ